MPLTLQEAQLVSWKVFRKINDNLDVPRRKPWDPLVAITDLLEESGGAASVIKGLEGYKTPNKPETKEMLAQELSNMLYHIFILAEHYGLNLEETFLEHVNEYLLRFIT